MKPPPVAVDQVRECVSAVRALSAFHPRRMPALRKPLWRAFKAPRP